MHHHTKIVLLSGILILVASVGLFVGAASLSIPQVIEHLVAFSSDDFVIHQYRLPRMLLAISVGAGLGLSGVLVQGVIRNPLAGAPCSWHHPNTDSSITPLKILK